MGVAPDPQSDLADIVEAARNVAALAAVGSHCDYGPCGREIVEGQHYVRLAAMVDSAGMDTYRIFDVPTMTWDGIYDTPACALLALASEIAKGGDSLISEPFLPR